MALCLVISAIVWVPIMEAQWEDHRVLLWLDLMLGILAYAVVPARRRWPLTVAVVTTLLGTASGLAAGPATLAAVSLATRRRLWQILPIGVLSLVTAQAFYLIEPAQDEPYLLVLGVNVSFIAAMLGWGMYIGSRRELLWTLRTRAERAEAEQEMRVGQARTNERTRIAREMHDVLAHRISQISMHAGALGFREDLEPDQMRDSARVIQRQAHDALNDLRGVLGVLREDGAGRLNDRPQPTYADLPALVGEARNGGMSVDFEDRLADDEAVPDVVGRTIYRIVQEGLTNARKHAPGALLTITVGGSPEGGIDVWLRNPIGFGPTGTPGSGLGLIGLSERAELRGGRLEHRRAGPLFELHGWIPWQA